MTLGSAEVSFLYRCLNNSRLNASPPSVVMPELRRYVFHTEGDALIRGWMDGMTPICP